MTDEGLLVVDLDAKRQRTTQEIAQQALDCWQKQQSDEARARRTVLRSREWAARRREHKQKGKE
jgi:hypothetical protein